MQWLLAKAAFGFTRLSWVIVAVVLIVLAWIVIASGERADDRANQTVGVTTERNKSLEANAGRIEEGRKAREEIRKVDDAGACVRYNQCLRSSRTGTAANCGRFLPEQFEDISCPSPK